LDALAGLPWRPHTAEIVAFRIGHDPVRFFRVVLDVAHPSRAGIIQLPDLGLDLALGRDQVEVDPVLDDFRLGRHLKPNTRPSSARLL
jgi:hypothetical protein